MAAGPSLSPKQRTVISTNLRPTKDCHFDRSCSRLCEQWSGEIRFSTQTLLDTTSRYLAVAVPLPVPLPVPAVILSAAKDPDDIDSPPPSNPFQPGSQPCLSTHLRNCPS
jgi:hypothetical protein